MKTKLFLKFALCSLLLSCSNPKPTFEMRGVVLSVEDLQTVDWPKLAAENDINTIGTHIHPEQVYQFIESEKGQDFLNGCKEYGIHVEHQLHAMKELLPREFFAQDSTLFRVNENGLRTPDANCCPSNPKALEIIAENAAKYAKLLPATNHRYYFWLDDGAPTCLCSACKELTASDQALIIENAMIESIRTVDPDAMLAHLAYHNTMEAPKKIKPNDGIFLEFAPFYRSWEQPIADPNAEGRGQKHAVTLNHLRENLKVFPAETAVILEYWLDVSLFSSWKKPAVPLPWNGNVFKEDIKTYAEFGIRNVTSFAVYMDSTYFQTYPDKSYLKEYGSGLKNLQLNK